jgi:hypothetical protein
MKKNTSMMLLELLKEIFEPELVNIILGQLLYI